MNLIEKLYSIIIFISVLIGISLGQFSFVRINAEFFIVPLLVAMLYITFLQIPISDIKSSFRNLKFTSTTIIMNFVWTPILAWILAMLFLSDSPALWIGFIMLMVTPCTDWYIIFTSIAKGNVALSATILPLNLLLQIILLPFYLLTFGGTTGVIELSYLAESVLVVLFIPLSLSIFTKILLKNNLQLKEKLFSKVDLLPITFLSLVIIAMFSLQGKILFNFTKILLKNNIQLKEKLFSKVYLLPITFLSLAIIAMFSSQGQILIENLDLLWKITIPILLFFIINFIIGEKIGDFMKFNYADKASFSLTTLARYSPIALAIAITAFPEEPLIALTLVVGPLLELPILAIISQILLLIKNQGSNIE